VPEWPTEIPDPTLDDIDKGLASGSGDGRHPDECAAGVQKWVDVGVDQLIMGPSGSTFSHEILAETVKLFGDEVIPRFDKGPGALHEPLPAGSRRQARPRLTGELGARTEAGLRRAAPGAIIGT